MRIGCCTLILLILICPSSVTAETKLFQETAAISYLQFSSEDDMRTAVLARAGQQIWAAVGQYISDADYAPDVIPDSAVFMGIASGILEPNIVSMTIEKTRTGFTASASLNAQLNQDTLKKDVGRFVDDPVYFPNAVANRVQVQELIEHLDSLEVELAKVRKDKGAAKFEAHQKKTAPDSRATLLRLRAIALNDRVIRRGEKGLQEDPEGILNLLNQALGFDKSNPWLFLHRGRAHSLLNDPSAAMGDYTRAISIDPYSSQAFYFRGLLYNSVKAYDLAIEDFDISISLDLTFEWPYVQRGIARREIGKLKQAIQDFDRAIQINPQNPQVYNERGITYHWMKLYENAVSEFGRAVQIDPGFAESYANRGMVFMDMGKKEAACRDWRKSCELASCERLNQAVDDRTCVSNDSSEAARWSKKSYDDVSHHQWDAAISAATLAISHDPALIYPYINRAWALAEIQAFDRALDDCDTAISIDPKFAAAYNNRGLVYQKMGDLEKAGNDYLKACSLGLETGCNNYLEVKRK